MTNLCTNGQGNVTVCYSGTQRWDEEAAKVGKRVFLRAILC
eukprot:COSAG06_NODE_4636_length_4078_cov_1.936919_1_plen_41_part_00